QWRVTRARIKAKKESSSDGLVRVQIRSLNGTVPGAVVEEGWLAESNLSSSYSWQTFNFSNVSGRTPGSSLALVVQWAWGDEACDVQYQALLAGGVNAYMVKTSNAGASWSAPVGQDFVYYVYG